MISLRNRKLIHSSIYSCAYHLFGYSEALKNWIVYVFNLSHRINLHLKRGFPSMFYFFFDDFPYYKWSDLFQSLNCSVEQLHMLQIYFISWLQIKTFFLFFFSKFNMFIDGFFLLFLAVQTRIIYFFANLFDWWEK